jgi:hypothetical protein
MAQVVPGIAHVIPDTQVIADMEKFSSTEAQM